MTGPAVKALALPMLETGFFARDPLTCATDLIGCELVWGRCSGLIVETEAYAAVGDEACHTFMRRGARKFVADHPAGTAYIYLNYGVHWLLNVLVKGGPMDGFVLIRALEPRRGLALMQKRRGLEDPRRLCSGPGKLTRALNVPPAFHGSSLCRDPARAFHPVPVGGAPVQTVADPRVGISRAADLPWRITLKDSPFLSRRPIPGGMP
jgi:DNA-3-methyladenine glycosylase